MRLYSPAKLNLFFRVLHKRGDGFHEIASLYQAIDLADSLEVAIADRDYFSCSDPLLPVDESNLVIKALHLFRKKAALPDFHVRCHLDKKIPIQAGLGGGSSDAATMLYACNELAGRPAKQDELAAWAGEIGSDVAFFFSSGTAYCTGRGELFRDERYALESVLPSGLSWLAKPMFGVATPAVYKATRAKEFIQRDPLEALASFKAGRPQFFNDLEIPAFELCPDLASVKASLLQEGFSTVMMTGSGSGFICLGKSSLPSLQDISFIPIRPIQRKDNSWYSL